MRWNGFCGSKVKKKHNNRRDVHIEREREKEANCRRKAFGRNVFKSWVIFVASFCRSSFLRYFRSHTFEKCNRYTCVCSCVCLALLRAFSIYAFVFGSETKRCCCCCCKGKSQICVSYFGCLFKIAL